MELTLAPACGPEDIVTPLGSKEELRRGDGRPLCRNFSSSPALEEKLREAMMRDDRPLRTKVEEEIRPYMKFVNHLDATRIKERLAPEFWNCIHLP